MAKVRFYCDVPEYRSDHYALCAWSRPLGTVPDGYKRVAFDVEMPPDLWKSFDVAGPTVSAIRVISDATGEGEGHD